MVDIGTAQVDFEISRAKVAAEVQATQRQVETGLNGSARRIADEYSKAAKAAVAGFGIYKGAQFLGDAISAASDLEEAQSKVNVVFEDSAGAVESFATDAATAIGQSERSALEASGTFGNLFTSMGIANTQAADMSTTLVTLASDLASFNNTSVDDALTALRSGLVGEQEPLRRFGVNINEATLKAKALELQLYSGEGALSANAKAQAAYALILEQTTNAQGDFERTSDNLANQQRILSAEFENTKAKLGEELVPAAQLGVESLSVLLGIIEKIPGPLLAGGVALGGLTVAASVLGPVIRTGWAELTAFTASTVRATTATTANTAAMNANASVYYRAGVAYAQAGGAAGIAAKGALAAAAGFTAFEVTTAWLEDSTRFKNLEELNTELANLIDGFGNPEDTLGALDVGGDLDAIAAQAKLASRQFSDAEKAATGFQTILNQLTPGTGNNDLSVTFDSRDIVEAQNAFEELDASLTAALAVDPAGATDAYRQIINTLREGGLTIEEIALLFPNFIDGMTASGQAARNEAAAHEENAAALESEIDARREAFDAEREVQDASRNTLEAVDALNKARAAARGESEEYRQAQERIADAEEGVADAADRVADAQEGVADAQERVQDAYANARSAARDVADAQRDLNDAYREGREELEDLQFAAEGAVLSQERAQLRLEAAREKLADVLNDPRSTERDRREADLAVREAELALREAQDKVGDTQFDLNEVGGNVENTSAVQSARDQLAQAVEAERAARDAIVDAQEGVQDAREAVTDATDAQRDAEGQLAEATESAAKVLTDAKGDVEDATRTLEDAVLDQAEAEAELAGATGDAFDANEAYYGSLDRLSVLLDDSSPFRQNLSSYIDDLREIDELSQATVNGRPFSSGGRGAEVLPGGNPPPVRPGTGGAGGNTINITTNNANAREIADEMAWLTGRGGG